MAARVRRNAEFPETATRRPITRQADLRIVDNDDRAASLARTLMGRENGPAREVD